MTVHHKTIAGRFIGQFVTVIICSMSVSGWIWCFCIMRVVWSAVFNVGGTSYYMCKVSKGPRAPASNLRCRSDRGAICGARAGRERLGWFSGIFKQVHWGLGQSCLSPHSHNHVACINPSSCLYFYFSFIFWHHHPYIYCIIRFICDAHHLFEYCM